MKITRFLGPLCVAIVSVGVASAQVTHVITVKDQVFSPGHPVIKQGDTVRWLWIQGYHTATEGPDGVLNGNEAFHYLVDPFNQLATHKFDSAFVTAFPRPLNTYTYFCNNPNHNMVADIIVVVPWKDLGFAKSGTSGNPLLTALGDMYPNTPGNLRLTNALPNSAAMLFVAAGPNTPVSFLGGTLAAFPVLVTLPATTSNSGKVLLDFTFPNASAPGALITFQWAIADPGATNGVALSNAMRATLP